MGQTLLPQMSIFIHSCLYSLVIAEDVAIEASPPHRIALTDGSLDFVSRKQGQKTSRPTLPCI